MPVGMSVGIRAALSELREFLHAQPVPAYTRLLEQTNM